MTDGNQPQYAMRRRTFVQSLCSLPALGIGTSAWPASPADSGILAGTWRYKLDRTEQGLKRRWFAASLTNTMILPGSLEVHRSGYPVGIETPWTGEIFDRSFFTAKEFSRYRQPDDFKVPFFLQPDSWYRGAAWFQRDFEVPADWQGRSIELFMERPHWETTVWVDDKAFGRSDALHVPHVYSLGVLEPGTHRLTVRVDNRMIVEIGQNGHGVTDHTQGNWNGIAGRIELRARPSISIDRVELFPTYAERTLRVRGRVKRAAVREMIPDAAVTFGGQTQTASIKWGGKIGTFEAQFATDPSDVALRMPWDEFSTKLHTVEVRLANGDQKTERFGWREVVPTANGFEINGRPAMLRGALDCSVFPLTGHPPTDPESWQRIMRRVKEYGLNHLRFHSYCPPQAAFDAADEIGIYLQIETVWANGTVHIGSGLPVDEWVYEETDRIIAEHGNHPSFIMMTHGNEPGGGSAPDGERRRDTYLAAYVRHYKSYDSRRLWTAGSGWPTIDESQYHVTPLPRIQQWKEELRSRINSKPPETVTDYSSFTAAQSAPVVSHEIGQWCVYPDFNEVRKYRGYLRPLNFDIFADRLRENGLWDQAPEFHYASGRLQVLCYKEEIESALRTPGMGGFQLLGLQDFPGQGTALVGVLDPFWDDKAYIDAAEYRRFCSPTVVLARMTSRLCASGDEFPFTLDVAHFGSAELQDAELRWAIIGLHGSTIANGSFTMNSIPLGNRPLSLSAAPKLAVEQPTHARLVVTLHTGDLLIAENDWDVWIYPNARSTVPSAVERSDKIDKNLLEFVAAGGSALVGLPAEKVANFEDHPVKLGFSSIFWNTQWTNRQAPTTLGILCDHKHPAFSAFPTDPHSNWQWWFPIHHGGALRLDGLPGQLQPLVRVIDDWCTGRSLGLIIEARLGKGKLIICGFPLDTVAASDLATSQLARSLEQYMLSQSFDPNVTLTEDQVLSLVKS